MKLLMSQPSGWPVVGQERAITMLRRSIRDNLLTHAYLFTGPPGVGKRTLALAFAMALNCEAEPPAGASRPDSPCGLCPSCGRTLRGQHPDVIEVNLETQAALNEESGKGKTPTARELK